MSTDEIAAREAIIQAVLRRLSGERDRPHAYQDADLKYADDMLLDAARQLATSDGAVLVPRLQLQQWASNVRTLTDNAIQGLNAKDAATDMACRLLWWSEQRGSAS